MRPVCLIGFPAAGKSTVGARAAAALGRRFVDLDDEIAAAAGRPVPALVAADEPAFRALEAATLARVLAASDGPIIATGGGAAVHGDNLARMRDAGLVVALHVELDAALARAASGERPLLARPRAELEALYAARAPSYRRAHATILADGSVDANVDALTALLRRAGDAAPRPWVCLDGDRSYPIVVDDAVLTSTLGPIAHRGRCAIVYDENVQPHVAAVADTLAAAGATPYLVPVAPGEASKSLETYGQLAADLVRLGLDRGSTIYALGGGVVGDLAGFVAATLYRGVAVVQLPTTLVAMTDSAIGGKTAIDLGAGKNLLGAFHQPRAVVAHLPWLATLPPRERKAGFGELWKYALLDGEAQWSATAALAPWAQTTARAPVAAAEVIGAAARLKASIVSVDERERTGTRALLNLGHTIGHAIEAAADWQLLHGEAVGLGLVAMARVSRRLGLADVALEGRIRDALAATGLPTDLDPWLTPAVLARVAVDKKRAGASVHFIACGGPGACRVVEVPTDSLAELLRP